jgi:PAS domain S-box-containing protein
MLKIVQQKISLIQHNKFDESYFVITRNFMDDPLVTTVPQNYINKFFWKSPNPMAITQAKDGKYIEVNEAFVKSMGLRRREMIGQTSVGIGYITAQQRSIVFNEIQEKGYAQNIELEIKVKNNETRCGLFNSSQIKMGKNGLWLTVVTDISESKKAIEERQNNILFKSLAAIEGTGVILMRWHQKKTPYVFFMNEEARRALNGRPITDLLDAINGHESTYFGTGIGCYNVKTLLMHHGVPGKIILLERMPNAVCIKEKLKQYDLTLRQEEIALLAAMGHSNKDIARELFIAEYTVKDHLKKIFQRIGVGKRSELCPKLLQWR